jgi:hypothetical protein
MDPNRQGYYQPDQGQPAAPQPVQQPSAPLAPPLAVNPQEIQAALNETAPQPVQPQAPTPSPVDAAAPAPTPIAEAEPVEVTDATDAELPADDEAPVTWTAHEYIHREKGTLWFVLFGIVIAALIAVSVLTKAWSFTALIVVIAVVVVVYTRRPPRELTYSLTNDGLVIDQTLHAFSSFKSFGIIRDGEEFSVMLIPTQRFQPGVTVYFPEEAGEDIVDMLGSRLPMKELHLDVVDRVVRILRL